MEIYHKHTPLQDTYSFSCPSIKKGICPSEYIVVRVSSTHFLSQSVSQLTLHSKAHSSFFSPRFFILYVTLIGPKCDLQLTLLCSRQEERRYRTIETDSAKSEASIVFSTLSFTAPCLTEHFTILEPPNSWFVEFYVVKNYWFTDSEALEY